MSLEKVYEKFDLWEHQRSMKLNQYKYQNICSFIENYITVFYEVYKKNKNSNISFTDYRKLMLQKLAEHFNPRMHILDPGENNNLKNN